MRLIRYMIMICFLGGASLVVNAQHAKDMVVGISAANQLKILVAETCEILLPETSNHNPFFSGWLSTAYGFNALHENDPNNDFFMMSGAHQISLKILRLENYLNNEPLLGFLVADVISGAFIDETNEAILIGSSNLHHHFNWHINDDSQSNIWQYSVDSDWRGRIAVTFILVDNGSYYDSEPFTFIFTNDDFPIGDITDDDQVDINDLTSLANYWLDEACIETACLSSDINQDGFIDLQDFGWIVKNWLILPEMCSL